MFECPVYDLTKMEWERKKRQLINLGKFVTESPYVDTIAECVILKEGFYKDKVTEVFHLDLGPKKIHCLVVRYEGVRKRKPIYEFTYHHRGKCPHCKLMLKRKTL